MLINPLKTIIIDDDKDWLELTSIQVKAHPSLNLIATFSSPIAANPLITEGVVDLILLDVAMPEVNGVDFMRHLVHPPLVIFITSHINFAAESYELNAVDYLIKPFSTPRFMQAIEKASLRFNEKQSYKPPKESEFFFIRENNQYVKIEINKILYLNSMQNYTQIITANHTHTTLMTLTEIEEYLPSSAFLRVHRSYLVNTSKITAISRTDLFINEHQIPIARNIANDVINGLVKSHLVIKGTAVR